MERHGCRPADGFEDRIEIRVEATGDRLALGAGLQMLGNGFETGFGQVSQLEGQQTLFGGTGGA
jgi:hypothetical protein